jgi:hypothetical protein
MRRKKLRRSRDWPLTNTQFADVAPAPSVMAR